MQTHYLIFIVSSELMTVLLGILAAVSVDSGECIVLTHISEVSGLVKHHQVTKEAGIISGSRITATQMTWIKLSLITVLLLHFRNPSSPFSPPSFLQPTLGEMQSGVCLLGETRHKALRLIFQLSAECLYSLMFREAAWEGFGVNNSILQLHSQNHCGSVTAYTTVGSILGCQELGVNISLQSLYEW